MIFSFADASSEEKPAAAAYCSLMREFDADLQRIARLSKLIAFGFWCSAIIAAGAFGYVVLVWLPRHYP
jgi:hypothetical protein